jgi:hypothetical protein
MLWRIYSLAVIRFRAAAVSIAAGSDAGQRMRRLLVKRPLEVWWGAAPMGLLRSCGNSNQRSQSASGAKTCSIEVAHRARKPNRPVKIKIGQMRYKFNTQWLKCIRTLRKGSVCSKKSRLVVRQQSSYNLFDSRFRLAGGLLNASHVRWPTKQAQAMGQPVWSLGKWHLLNVPRTTTQAGSLNG